LKLKENQEKAIRFPKQNFIVKNKYEGIKKAQAVTKLGSSLYKSKVNPHNEFNGKELTNALMRLRNKENSK
jgi:hypothetical protein